MTIRSMQKKPVHSPQRQKEPPGERGHLLLGNLPAIQKDVLGFLTSVTHTHGDIVKNRFFIWSGYLLNHPDYAKHVLQDNHRNYNKQNFDYEMLRIVLGQGLLTSDGDFWLKQRRLIQPAFHRQRIQAFAEMMIRTTQAMLEDWHRSEFRSSPVDISYEMMRLTLQIVGKALFSQDVSGDAERVGRAFPVVNEFISMRFRQPIPLPLWLPTAQNRKFKAAIRELNDVVEGIIRRRRAGALESTQGDHDLLSTLLEARDEETGQVMNDAQLRDEILTLLLAGHETTANALSWTWYLLSQNPAAADCLHLELQSVLAGRTPTIADLVRLPYTRMVIQESMRLYPPAWIISRQSIGPDEIGGYPIPANTRVSISPYLIHRHPDFWPNPEMFDPQRFAPEQTEARPPYAYFPFGGGPRLCIGRDFAMLEAQLILATIAQQFHLELVPRHPVELEPLITLRPKYGIKMMIQAQGV